MAGNLPPQLPPQMVFLHSFGEPNASMPNKMAYRQAVTMGDSGVNIPNSVCTVSGQMTYTAQTQISAENNRFTITCVPLVADTPTLNIQQINNEITNNPWPKPNVSSHIWNCDVPAQSNKQLPLVWIPVGTFTYIGQLKGGIVQQNLDITTGVLNWLTGIPNTEVQYINGLLSVCPREYISNPFGSAARAKNFNSVNTVVCVPGCNTIRRTFGAQSANPLTPNFINATSISLNDNPIVNYVAAVQCNQAPLDTRNFIVRNPYGWFLTTPTAAIPSLFAYNNLGFGWSSLVGSNPGWIPTYIDIVTINNANANYSAGEGAPSTNGPCLGAACIGGYPDGRDTFLEIETDGVEKIYGQNFFNTFCYTLSIAGAMANADSNGYITNTQFPQPGMHPYDFIGHNGNFTYDHQISFVTSMTFLVNRDRCTADNDLNGYHVFPINNSEDSAMNGKLCNPRDPYSPKIGHAWLPFINRSGVNLFHPGWPIPCHQVTNAAPQPSAANNGARLQSDFTTFIGYESDVTFQKDQYNFTYTSGTRAELATGANIKYGTCDFPKNKNVHPGYVPSFFNFPQTPYPVQGIASNNYFISQDNPDNTPEGFLVGDVGGYWVANLQESGSQYSNNWLCEFPEGVCSDGAFVYTGRMAMLYSETLDNAGNHTGNYTTPYSWKYTFVIPPGMYTANSLLYAINKEINTQIPGTNDFPLYRYVDMRDGGYICSATDYEDDDLLPWAARHNACQTGANRQGPSSVGNKGRIVSIKKGPNTVVQLGAKNFSFNINADGKLAFNGTYTIDSSDVIATSTLADGVAAVYYLPTSYSRSGIDPPLWGNLGQTDLSATTEAVLVVDPECWAQAPSVRMIRILESDTTNLANNLSKGFGYTTNVQCQFNSAGSVTGTQIIPDLLYSENNTIASGILIQQSAQTFPAAQNYTGNSWPSIVVTDLATHAQASINMGIYFNPCGSAFLPGSTGIQIMSLCDGSKVERKFWETLGFDPDNLVNFWRPSYETVLPIEGMYYNPNNSTYGYSKEAFCVSNESPYLWRSVAKWYIMSAPSFPISASVSTQIDWINNTFLPTLPIYYFDVPYFASYGAVSLTAPASDNTIFGNNVTGWGNGVLTNSARFGTNCPLFCTVFAGIPDYYDPASDHVWNDFEKMAPDDFMLKAYLNNGNFYTALNGQQKYAAVLDGPGSGAAGSGDLDFLHVVISEVNHFAEISITDLVGMNPYNMHQSIPRPLNSGIFATSYSTTQTDVDVSGLSCNWPIEYLQGQAPPGNDNALGKVLYRPTYTGCTQSGWFANLSQTYGEYELISGTMISWPFPASGGHEDGYWAVEYSEGSPLIGINAKHCAMVINGTSEYGGIYFSHRSFQRLLDQGQLMCPTYTYNVATPDVVPVLSGLDYYLQSGTDAIVGYGPRWSGVGPAPFLNPTVRFSWIEILAITIQEYCDSVTTIGDGFPYCMYPNAEAIPLYQWMNLRDRGGWQIPVAGRIRCDQVPTYYYNSTPLQYERGTAGLLSEPDIRQVFSAQFPLYNSRGTHYMPDQDGYAVNIGSESRKVKFCTNLSITNSVCLGYIFNSSTSTIAGSTYANTVANISSSTFPSPQIPTVGSGNVDPSDPVQITNLFAQSYTAYGPFQNGNLNQDGMFVVSIKGTPNFELAVPSWINGFRARNYIPVAVQSSYGLTNTISFNTSIPFNVAAQIVDTLLFEFFDVNLKPLTNIVNIRMLLTFTPTGQPTPEELAFISGAAPAQIQSQVPSQVNFAGPNSILAQPPNAFNAAGIKRPSGEEPFQTAARPGIYPKYVPNATAL